jgi:hypothetical protein
MSLTISESTGPDASWEPLARERGLFYHQPRWVTILGDAYAYPLTCLTATMEGRTVGFLALADVPGLVGPRRLVSLPFSYAAGPLAESGEIADQILLRAREIAEDRRTGRLEIKQREPWSDRPAAGRVRIRHYSSDVLQTAGGEAGVWDRLHPSSTRRGIRKAEKEGVSAHRATSKDDWLEMARLEEETAHRHGVPAPPRRFFLGACRALQEDGLADLYLARLRGGGVAAGIVIWKGPREWIYAYGASRPESLPFRPNHMLLWTAIRDAIATGVSFDFGRAAPEQEGLVEFKRRWGGQPVPLSYDYWPSAGGLNVADRSRGPLALAARLWSRLPARLTRSGSFLYRYLG